MRTFVTVGDHDYLLAPNADVEGIKAEILTLVRSGGGFVDLPLPGGRVAISLVSAGMTVRFVERPDEDDPGDPAVGHTDYDWI